MLATLALISVLQDPGCPCCVFNEFSLDPGFNSMHPLKEPTGWSPVDGKMTTFKDTGGRATNAFWVPPSGDSKACIVMVHEYWGLNEHIKETAEKIHSETGYGVLAIDMYKGKVAATGQEAGALMRGVDETYGRSVVGGAVKALKDGSVFSASSIGTVGYCFGGGWSHRTAIAGGSNVDACVIYYGAPEISQTELKKLKAPVLMMWPTQDQWINKELVDGFKAAMKTAGKSLRVEAYDANHAFANPSNARHNEKASADAWKKMIAFYKDNLH